jgi:hypothetical protein
MRSARAINAAQRSAGVAAAQPPSNAVRAAVTAVSTSSASLDATSS